MKQIQNISTTIKKPEGDYMLYSDLVKAVCNMPVQGGFSMTDIEQRMAIMKACDKAEGFIVLDNIRVEYLKAITATSKWGAVHEDLLGFAEAIKTGWTEV